MTYRPLWTYDLQPASFRGVPFYVEHIETRAMRRTAVHEYPGRNLPWVEDLGLGLIEYNVRGFLNGDDVTEQFAKLYNAGTIAGPAEFVHPRIGSRTCSLVATSYGEDKEAGNVVRFQFTFIASQTESSTTLWPRQAAASGGNGVAAAAANSTAASSGNFLTSIRDAVRDGRSAVAGVVTTARGYVSDVQTAVSDASRAVNSVAGIGKQLGIPGLDFSRYLAPLNKVTGALTSVSTGLSTVSRVTNTTTSLIASSTTAVGRVQSGATSLLDKVSRL